MDISKIKKLNKMFENLTPLKVDCGSLCNCCCCHGDDDTGMYLLPGEETLFDGKKDFKIKRSSDSQGLSLLVCRGNCNRDERPFSCRIYPFFPLKFKDGKINVIFDPRAVSSCPIYNLNSGIDRRFLKTVKKAGKIINNNKNMSKYIDDISKMIYDIIDLENVLEGKR